MIAPVQGLVGQKIRRYITIGGEWDEFSAQYNNDTTSVTVSANGTAKSYNQYVPYPDPQTNDPLVNYLVLIIQVSGYITLASGATSGSATVSVVMNGTTLYSTTISNTNNQLIINQIIPYSNFPSGYHPDYFNTLQIDVTIGTGTASVTISQVQYMFAVYLNGGTTGLTIQIPISQGITYINDDPSIFTPNLANAFGLGAIIAHYDPFGLTTGQATYNANSGQVNLVANNTNSIWMIRAMPTTISNGVASGTLTISVGANQSVLIGYFVFAIIINNINVAKGHLREDIYVRYLQLGNPGNGIQITNAGFGLPEDLLTGGSNITTSLSNFINQMGSATDLWQWNFNWADWPSYANQSPAKQVGNSYLYVLSNTTPKAVIHIDTIAYFYNEADHEQGVFGNGAFNQGGMAIARMAFVEVEE